MTEIILEHIGYVKPSPTQGEVQAVKRALSKGWTHEQLLDVADTKSSKSTGNPRTYTLTGIGQLGKPPPRPDETYDVVAKWDALA